MAAMMGAKRLLKEKKRLYEDANEIKELGIYVHWGDTVNTAKAMIIGPANTPYEYGFFFFDIKFPDTYPIKPPEVKFCTGDGRVRFNPNLYVEGKVCLSILGTWSGPSWTSSLTMRTVLLSIQSLLDNHPITNEPGHGGDIGTSADKTYTEIIRYETINVAVVEMFERTPKGFEVFHDTMREQFLRRYDNYCETIKKYAEMEEKTIRSPIWDFRSVYRTKSLLEKLQNMKTNLIQGGVKVWTEHVDKEGKTYYYNIITKVSTHDKPADVEISPSSTKAVEERTECHQPVKRLSAGSHTDENNSPKKNKYED